MASSALPSERAPGRGRSSLWRRIRANAWSYVFITPAVIGTLLFAIYPIPASFRYAFYNWNGIGEPREFVGFRHFVTVATDPIFWQSFRNSVTYTVVLVPVQLTLALILALVLNNSRLPLRNVFRTIYFLPIVTSMIVIGVVLRFMFQALAQNLPPFIYDAGIVNPVLGFLASPQWALPSIIAVGIWHSFGYNLIFFLAALQGIPQELYEAATLDGADARAKFWHITLPLIRPVGVIILFWRSSARGKSSTRCWRLPRAGRTTPRKSSRPTSFVSLSRSATATSQRTRTWAMRLQRRYL
ncbi:sugar ABC transporter permease [Candidatus Gracilibacteria bacterium]|nr:sugar ABC transporter permease [Candidatus Gracilibacteria bacterium]